MSTIDDLNYDISVLDDEIIALEREVSMLEGEDDE